MGEEELAGKIMDLLVAVDDVDRDADERKRLLVELATKAAGELPTGCPILATVDGSRVRCGRDGGHGGSCSFRSPAHTGESEKPAEGDLGSLDDLLEWVPDPGPIREEILAKLAKLPPLAELDEVAVLVGRLAALVDAPG